jgi:hypothetical protein
VSAYMRTGHRKIVEELLFYPRQVKDILHSNEWYLGIEISDAMKDH